MLRIRLSQTGKKHDRKYRIVVGEKRSKRDGKMTDSIGFWDPKNKKLEVNNEKYLGWIKKGAQPSEVVRNLVNRGL